MPKVRRSHEEIEAVREDIMGHALELIVADGFDGLSMRRLAGRLGIAAKTIYNYFHSKDELYLGLLTKGFAHLLECFEAAAAPHTDPAARLEAVIEAYVNFGFERANMYNLMFTWHVPKYNDYVGTPMEEVARQELAMALKCADFFMESVRACIRDDSGVGEEDLRFELVQAWSQMHGYIAGINNALLDYMHEDPLSLKERMISRICRNIRLQDDQT
ncbi:MAG: TetR/AcrR family transcriptional regulator [Desulfobacterales bacterium]|nr:TetR/AcrR family transcriptional regulator [Desulfobacterales bacterium]